MKYLALLGNVDSSILGIDLGDGFVIEEMTMVDFADMCEGSFITADVWSKLDHEWGCVPFGSYYRPEYVYIIKKNLDDYPEFQGDPADIEAHMPYWEMQHKFHGQISKYLGDRINKLRLFKEGSIRISIEFYYTDEDDELEMFSSMENTLFCENRLFSLNQNEVPLVNEYLSSQLIGKLPKYLEFSLSNFEQSYHVPHIEFEFLSLMISLEALLNDGKTELRLRVSRGCAVLLGEDRESSREIFKVARELYDKRSALVHTGDRKKINKNDVLKMKELVRKSLKRALELNLSKQDLSQLLMESGFGRLNENLT
ncbi:MULTISPECIES: HEPN domain-containing protein [Halomonadaceae]|uniref:Apea-like HEPN domain-containing protein n=1 Tax=Vreelandella titanicae TaxID=664683 RepID=A0AAP9NLJ3_9GAMM|nr:MULTISPECIES: HEPN domain-containing protein [Halomonas]QKS23936.1 hypothetical protein FX987_01703 [Halomonas titanicae]CDG54825.1 hypothetical protein HALA3H3_800152 [Halomonas sp. A3H3]SDI73528.1 hypothetical protein SAMN04487867_112149 [Halomonas titanicae]|tara:strand:+ start:1249 stop:2184 length:936 start_codon:yes stop_codon:yes gene_type:complete